MSEHEPHSYDEYELIRRAQAGEEAAYAAIFRQYHRKIYQYITWRIPHDDRETADDLTQTVLLKIFTSLSHYRRTESNFEAWVMKLAHHTVIDYHRQQGRSKEDLTLDEITEAVEESLVQQQPSTEQIALARIALQRVLASLTPEELATLPLATGEVKSHEFGEAREESSSASRKRLHGMRVKLRHLFGNSQNVA